MVQEVSHPRPFASSTGARHTDSSSLTSTLSNPCQYDQCRYFCRDPPTIKYRPFASKRATWTNGTSTNAAPMPILPSIRPISPFSDSVNAQAHSNPTNNAAGQAANANLTTDTNTSKKIGRQLSVHSNGGHYTDYHRQEAERALNGQRGPISPNSEQKEGFFSHLRKRARRFSGKPTAPVSPTVDDIEANAGCVPWQSNRSSMIVDSNMDSVLKKSFNDVDKVLQLARTGAEPLSPSPEAPSSHKHQHELAGVNSGLDRYPSLSKSASSPSLDSAGFTGANGAPISSRTRRALHRSMHPSHIYDTPEEEDELLHEALDSAQTAAKRTDRRSKLEEQDYLRELSRQPLQNSTNVAAMNPYPTPSPSAKRNGILFDQNIMAEPVSPSTSPSNDRIRHPIRDFRRRLTRKMNGLLPRQRASSPQVLSTAKLINSDLRMTHACRLLYTILVLRPASPPMQLYQRSPFINHHNQKPACWPTRPKTIPQPPTMIPALNDPIYHGT